jgi:hypothetical protein
MCARVRTLVGRVGMRSYEPIWSAIPANKAILPILSQMYPDHPFLLRSHLFVCVFLFLRLRLLLRLLLRLALDSLL